MNTPHRHIHRALRAQAFWNFTAASVSTELHRGTEPDPLAHGCPVPRDSVVLGVGMVPSLFLHSPLREARGPAQAGVWTC